MPRFVWSEPDFISVLEVAPEVTPYGESHTFRVARDGLTLVLSVSSYDGDVDFTLHRDGVDPPVLELRLVACPGARRVIDPGGRECLEFAAARVFGGRYDGESHIPHGVRLTAVPHLSIQLF